MTPQLIDLGKFLVGAVMAGGGVASSNLALTLTGIAVSVAMIVKTIFETWLLNQQRVNLKEEGERKRSP